MKNSRIASIETFRVIAIFAVICLHTRPFYPLIKENENYKFLFYAIDSFCRFATPYFFITIGYFFGKQLNSGIAIKTLLYRYLKKFFFIFIVWSLIYGISPRWLPIKHIIKEGLSYNFKTLLTSSLAETLNKIQTSPLNFLTQGPSPPLWFLVAAMFALIILTIFVLTRKQKYLIIFSVLLYLFGVLSKAYSKTPLGIHLVGDFNTRNGPFFSTFFVTFGWWFSSNSKPLSAQLLVWLTAGGFLLQETEAFFLWLLFKIPPNFDYLFGTIPFGIGIFFIAIKNLSFGQDTMFPKIAILTLGIYVSHLYMLPYVGLFNRFFHPIIWQILFPLLLFFVSAIFVSFLMKSKFTRFLVK